MSQPEKYLHGVDDALYAILFVKYVKRAEKKRIISSGNVESK